MPEFSALMTNIPDMQTVECLADYQVESWRNNQSRPSKLHGTNLAGVFLIEVGEIGVQITLKDSHQVGVAFTKGP